MKKSQIYFLAAIFLAIFFYSLYMYYMKIIENIKKINYDDIDFIFLNDNVLKKEIFYILNISNSKQELDTYLKYYINNYTLYLKYAGFKTNITYLTAYYPSQLIVKNLCNKQIVFLPYSKSVCVCFNVSKDDIKIIDIFCV